MSVSISIDKPDVTVSVKDYDGYVEGGGVSAPTVMRQGTVTKIQRAGQAASAQAVMRTGTVDKPQVSGSSASAPTVMKTGSAPKGPTRSGSPASAGAVMRQGTAKHLKPTHRWQMPLPRNLLDDPESFDPATTAWGITSGNTTYDGTVDNVGPNGETAAKITLAGDGSKFRADPNDFPTPATTAIFVRAVSGTVDVIFDNFGIPSKTETIGTEWQWFTQTHPAGDTLQTFEFRGDGEIYILRAGLNRGSTLEYSTRSAVPQMMKDVVAGADLGNGSDPGADTNDLDFAVDGSGVPYAVADGDDETSTLPQDGTETWAVRVYVPASVGADVQYLGDSALGYPTLVYDDANGDLRIRYKDSSGTTQQGPSVAASEGSWHTVAMTVDGSDLRLNVDGTTDQQTGTDLSITADPRLLGSVAGARVQHPEQHPVLSEAEAVRKRLASNPADPVPKTEAWDSTVGSGSTLPALRQSSNDIPVGASVSWVDPIGLSDDGGGSLLTPTKRPTVTWVGRVKYTATRAFGRNANGWKVTATDLVVEDESGTTASAAHGKTINDGTYHTIAVLIDEVAETAEAYIDGATTPDATVDLSTVGTLKSSDVELLPEGGTMKQPAYYTRPLTGEEIAYLHERLVDNPESAFPTYALP